MSDAQAPDAPAQDQPSTEGNDAGLNGDESGEQLEDQGFPSKTGAAHERIRKLARERNEAKKENELLRQELLKSRVVPQNGQANGAQNGNHPQVQPGPPPFDRPAPDQNASDEEKLDYLIDKKAHERGWHHAMRLGQELVQALAPALAGPLEAAREKEWDQLGPSLDLAGTSRDEMEPLVNEVLKADPRRSLRSATFDIMDRMNLLGGRAAAPTPPAQTKPGANGKPRVPGTGQPAKPKAPTMQDGFRQMRESVKAGDRVKANTTLGELLLQQQDGRQKRR